MSTRTLQRVESAVVAVVAVVAAVAWYPSWWWVLLAAFLLFDLSMVGYVRSPGVGAACYNAVHTYVWPGALAVVAIVTAAPLPPPPVSTAAGVAACAWAFHVGVDRMLGYGLKLPEGFDHTHLGRTGKRAAPSS
ncbi:DUF4260 family protein [Actinomycetospora flava]|uniref:DUF4260 family protein n=1 Tax=Actinomycetospora flava TaxID=3129232 RepID=A0ABU8M8R4_9PSEU